MTKKQQIAIKNAKATYAAWYNAWTAFQAAQKPWTKAQQVCAREKIQVETWDVKMGHTKLPRFSVTVEVK